MWLNNTNFTINYILFIINVFPSSLIKYYLKVVCLVSLWWCHFRSASNHQLSSDKEEWHHTRSHLVLEPILRGGAQETTNSPYWSGSRKSSDVDRVEIRAVKVGGNSWRLRLQHFLLWWLVGSHDWQVTCRHQVTVRSSPPNTLTTWRHSNMQSHLCVCSSAAWSCTTLLCCTSCWTSGSERLSRGQRLDGRAPPPAQWTGSLSAGDTKEIMSMLLFTIRASIKALSVSYRVVRSQVEQ